MSLRSLASYFIREREEIVSLIDEVIGIVEKRTG